MYVHVSARLKKLDLAIHALSDRATNVIYETPVKLFFEKKIKNEYFIGKSLGMKYFENYDMVCIL